MSYFNGLNKLLENNYFLHCINGRQIHASWDCLVIKKGTPSHDFDSLTPVYINHKLIDLDAKAMSCYSSTPSIT